MGMSGNGTIGVKTIGIDAHAAGLRGNVGDVIAQDAIHIFRDASTLPQQIIARRNLFPRPRRRLLQSTLPRDAKITNKSMKTLTQLSVKGPHNLQ
jgi:hypothetical protein